MTKDLAEEILNIFNLLEKMAVSLAATEFNVFTNELVPPNDGGIALGQAFVGVRQVVVE